MKMGINVIVGNMERTMQCPFLDIFGERNEEMMDLMYMRRMYPKEMSRIQSVIDDTCDRMEYDGSMMYDEYPDRYPVHRPRKESFECGYFARRLRPHPAR